jgi:hypothetical protein
VFLSLVFFCAIMSTPDHAPSFPEFSLQLDKPKLKDIKPPPKYQSIDFLTFVVLGLNGLIGLLAIGMITAAYDLKRGEAEFDQLDAFLEAPPAGTTQAELRRSTEQAKIAAAQLFSSNDMLVKCSVGTLGAVLVLGIAFSSWVYKATGNLPALKVEPLKYAPWIAGLGMWLIPVVVGIPLLNQLVKGSDPNSLTPYGHRSEGFSPLVLAWWLATLVSVVLGWLFTSFYKADFPSNLPPRLTTYALAGLLYLPHLMGMWLVGSVFFMQRARLEIAENPIAVPAVKAIPEYQDT